VSLFLDGYDLGRAAKVMESVTFTGGTAVFVSGLYLLIPYVTPTLPNRRLFIFLLPLLVTLAIVTWRILYATLFSQPTFRRQALIIGAGQSGQRLAQMVANISHYDNGTIYNIMGFIDDDLNKQQQMISGIPVLGTGHDLLKLAQKLRPDEIIIAITHSHLIQPKLFQAVLDCRELGIPITTMIHFYESLTGRVPVAYAGKDLQVILPIDRPAIYRLYLAFRRGCEWLIALLGCLFLLILIPFIWLGNRLTNPGDLFYRQERVREGGKVFQVVKFRSMVMDAEQGTGVVWARENDERITPVGHLLRKARLDEMPQFWNVLKGEMSLIGPRPERPSIIATLEKDIPFYRVRHAVRPGITGWAQVCYRYGASVDDALVKLEYDLYYIKYQSWYLDLVILVKTARVVLGLRGQ
jgi:exopolysaccharide biosynthesis polyprenyl glycosylphosphotransferase